MRHASYKVAVTDHADTKEDTKDNFTEVLWRVPSADWKPTGVSIKPREENQLVIHWWRRSDSAWLRESVKRLRLKDLPNDSSGGATAPGGDMAPRSWQPRMELGDASGSSPNRQMELATSLSLSFPFLVLALSLSLSLSLARARALSFPLNLGHHPSQPTTQTATHTLTQPPAHPAIHPLTQPAPYSA